MSVLQIVLLIISIVMIIIALIYQKKTCDKEKWGSEIFKLEMGLAAAIVLVAMIIGFFV